MHIEIWSDVICPFCYIGKTQLEAALAQAGLTATIEHRAFRLMPGEATAPVEEMFARKYGQSPEQAKASMRNVEAMAAQSGLEFHIPGTMTGDTTDAHKLLLLAADKGVQSELLNRLYRAYFTEIRNVFDRDTLVQIGEAAGLKREDMAQAFNADTLTQRVQADQSEAQALGVRGVPFVVIDRVVGVSGAQGVDGFKQALKAALEHAPQVSADSGDACGPDHCEPAQK